MIDAKAIAAELIADGTFRVELPPRREKASYNAAAPMKFYQRYRRIVCPYTGTMTEELIDEKVDYSISAIEARLGRLNEKTMSTATLAPT